MKTSTLFLAFVLVIALAVAVHAIELKTCDDTDKGPTDPEKPVPFIGLRGAVTDTSGKYLDECIDNPGGKKVKVSTWIRERRCKDGRLESREYNCVKYGYDSCSNDDPRGAACVYGGTPNQPFCGDSLVNQPGEQCDPPNSKCKDANGNEGKCNLQCKCVIPIPKKPPKTGCGNNVKEPWEECDPPKSPCQGAFGIGICDEKCKCVSPNIFKEGLKPYCGNRQLDPGEWCDPPGIPCISADGKLSACGKNCQCPVMTVFCGDNFVSKPYEDCEKDSDCKPGMECNKCKCTEKRKRTVFCGDFIVDRPTEQCEKDADCLESMLGQKCIRCRCYGERITYTKPPGEEKKTVPPPEHPPQAAEPQKSCRDRCAGRGLSDQPTDFSQYIMQTLQQYSCVSGVQIVAKGTLTLSGPDWTCKCYSKDNPEIRVDQKPPVCESPCGRVECGKTATCPCPGKPNCTITASCSWKGWQWQRDRAVPNVGAQTSQSG